MGWLSGLLVWVLVMSNSLAWAEGIAVIVNRPVDYFVRQFFYERALNSKPTQKFDQSNTPIPFRTIIRQSSLATLRFVNNLPEAIGYLFK